MYFALPEVEDKRGSGDAEEMNANGRLRGGRERRYNYDFDDDEED